MKKVKCEHEKSKMWPEFVGFQVIAETRNTVNETKNATRHAEINAVDVVEALGMCIILLLKQSSKLKSESYSVR